METKYAHIITILRRIDPVKKYSQFNYYDVKNFETAWFGATKGEIFMIDNTFYQVDKKEVLSNQETIKNLIVKHGRHIVTELTVN